MERVTNYPKEAKYNSNPLIGEKSKSADVEQNYQLFMTKYMQKDEQGNIIKIRGKWNTGNTPKTSSEFKSKP